MYALMMMVSGAALAAAQPIDQPTGLGAGPIREESLAVKLTAPPREAPDPDQDQQIRPLNLDLPAVADGAELHFHVTRLKLKVPI